MDENYHKTEVVDLEITGLVKKMEVPSKRPGTTRKEQIPYETMYMDYPYIVSMAWKIDDKETKHFIINQDGREIPKEASDIHGITTEVANKSPHFFKDVILEFVSDSEGNEIFVGHNIYFDTSIIKANVLRLVNDSCGISEDVYETITDILHKHKRIDTAFSPAVMKMMRGLKSLSELHMKLFRKGFNSHMALEDVEACYRCYQWLKKKGMVPTWEKLQEKAKEAVNV